jgi:hypothetical protein
MFELWHRNYLERIGANANDEADPVPRPAETLG